MSETEAAESQPLVITHRNLPPLAPLQRLTPHHKADVAQYLTFTEAVSLMLTARDIREALLEDPRRQSQDPRLLFHDFRKQLAALGCNRLISEIQDIDTEIDRAKWQPAAKPSLWPPKEKKKQAAAREHEREQQAQKGELVKQLQALEPEIEKAVFHVASRRRPPPPPEDSNEAELTHWQLAIRRMGPLYSAVENGDVEMVRMGLRELLSLPTRLIATDRKVSWLGAPHGRSNLYTSGQRCCGTLRPSERLHYETVAAFVEEIAGSPHLDLADKARLCVRLKVNDVKNPSNQQGMIDIVAFAMGSNNPAFAAAVLLGINESAAPREVKHALLMDASASWRGGLDECVMAVSTYLRQYRHGAPRWVDDVISRLQRISPAEASHQPPQPSPKGI